MGWHVAIFDSLNEWSKNYMHEGLPEEWTEEQGNDCSIGCSSTGSSAGFGWGLPLVGAAVVIAALGIPRRARRTPRR